MYADIGQITVDADIAAVTYHDHHATAKAEHSTYLTIEDATRLGTGTALDIDTLVVECHIAKTFHVILAKMADDTIAAGNGHGQTTAITLEAAADTHILSGSIQDSLSLPTRCRHLLGMFASLSLGTLLRSNASLFGLTGLALGSLTGLFVLGSLGFLLGTLLTGGSLSNTTGILTGCSLGSSLFTC